MTFAYDDIGKRSMYQHFQRFIRSKIGILIISIFR